MLLVMRTRTLQDRPCIHCGTVFRPSEASQRFCSRPCHYQHTKVVRVRTCPTCGSKFHPKTKLQNTCSVTCAFRPKRVERSYCLLCGEMCPRPRMRYCSKKCAGTARLKIPRGPCKQCGVQLKDGRRRFCTLSCAARWRAENVTSRRSTRPLGSKRAAGHGYIKVKTTTGWRFEHRAVMEKKLGRPLMRAEQVHHVNGDPSDNRSENLELWQRLRQHPSGIRAADYHCPGCRCFEKVELS